MSKYYIVDSTLRKGKKDPVLLFESTDSVVKYLEGMCSRKFRQTRVQYMDNVESLGFGGNDQAGRSFYDQMEQYFNMGVIRPDSTPVKCNIFEARQFGRNKEAHGD